NDISINMPGWNGFYDSIRAGIWVGNVPSPITDIQIVHNHVTWTTTTRTDGPDYYVSMVSFPSFYYTAPTVPFTGLVIQNNLLQNSPGAGIPLQNPLDQVTVSGNQIENPGVSANTYDNSYRSAIYISSTVQNVNIQSNGLIDNQAVN